MGFGLGGTDSNDDDSHGSDDDDNGNDAAPADPFLGLAPPKAPTRRLRGLNAAQKPASGSDHDSSDGGPIGSSDDNDNDSDDGGRIQRRRRRHRKFGEDDSDNSEEADQQRARDRRSDASRAAGFARRGSARPGGGGHRGGRASTTAAPTFTRAQTEDTDAPPPPLPAARPRPPTSAASALKPTTPSAPPSRPVDRNFGKFAGTGGLGLKLLMKMGGYTPGAGLGKHGQGTVEPVKINLRAKDAGIGFDDADWAEPAPEQDTTPRASSRNGGGGDSTPRAAKTTAPAGHLRRNQYRRKRDAKPGAVTGDTGAARMDMGEAPILDLRGTPSVSPFSTAAVTHLLDTLTGSALASLSAAEIRRKKRAADIHRAEELRQVLARARQRHVERQGRMAALEHAIESLRLAHTDRQPSGGADNSQKQTWSSRVASDDVEAWKDVLAPAVAAAGVAQLRKALGPDWEPFDDAMRGHDVLDAIRSVAAVKPHAHHHGHSTPPGEQPPIVASVGVLAAARGTYYDSVIWNVWLPPVRSWLQSVPEWLTDGAVALHVADTIAQWRDDGTLSPALASYLVHHVVLPRLKQRLDALHPKSAPPSTPAQDIAPPVLMWLHPWFTHGLLDGPADTLFDGLRSKLGATIDSKFRQSSHMPPSALVPWRQYLSPSVWSMLRDRHLAPGLIAHARARIRIDPAKQDTAPLDALLAWVDAPISDAVHAGAHLVACALVDGGIFAQWALVVHGWLTAVRAGALRATSFSSSDHSNINNNAMAEVARWYRVWREAIPMAVWDDAAVVPYRAAALWIMELATVEPISHALPSPEVLVPGFTDAVQGTLSSSSATATSLTGHAKKKFASAPVPQRQMDLDLSIEKYLAKLLDQHGLVSTSVNAPLVRVGCPVHRITRYDGGKSAPVYLYFQNDVIFMRRTDPVPGPLDLAERVEDYWDPVLVDTVADRFEAAQQAGAM
ncbi:GC-rich sequence DNA-binding factor-like protein-domain-containing protein [Blastocladiella britannica]|nr:GC-rich sequence DNA-binding factor-like protein-domain-containing protein [Blastocladiella britannica]